MKVEEVGWKGGIQRQNASTGLRSAGEEFPAFIGLGRDLYGE